jgi:hypothetical protein
MTKPITSSATLDTLLAQQDGVVDTRSVLAHLSPEALRWRMKSGRWQQPCRGVVVAHSGPLTEPQMLRIATIWGGSGAAVAGLTAARLQGLHGFDDWTNAIHLLLPATRTARAAAPPISLVVHYSRHLTQADIHPARHIPQTRIARSLVDAAAWMRTDRGAQAVLAAGVQQGLTIVPQLAAEVERNQRLNRRKLIVKALGDIAGGSHALSELDFIRLVVRQFNLPVPDRQVPRRDENGRRRWLDACWEKARLIVEIDGAAHLDVLTYWDDMDRANDLILEHYRILRFPAWVVRSRPEYVATKIRQALREAGYRC